MTAPTRNTLAFIEGFRRPPPGQAHGTHAAAYALCQALARVNRYEAFHLYHDRTRNPALHGDVVLPITPPTATFEKRRLRLARDRYAAISVSNGDQILCAPHVLRPERDWAPVICSIGTAHANGQWTSFFLMLASGGVRASDGLVFKSRAAQRLFDQTFGAWSQRFGFSAATPALTTVIPNGVDVTANRRSEPARRQMRKRLGLADTDVVYLVFSRLDPGTKGDHEALLVRWKDVVAQAPGALLLLTGAATDGAYVADLRQLAGTTGVGDRVRVIENPLELGPGAHNGLMSAADVFVHLSTGVEEASSLAVHEALAHGLPVIATAWAGMPEVVVAGETGFLIETRAGRLGSHIATTLFSQTDRTHLIDASRMVWCDFRAVVTAAVTLADAETRARMGAAARTRAEASDVDAVARRFVAFFDACAAAAEAAWTGPVATRPLVDLNAVIASQATGLLDPRTAVRIGDLGRLNLVAQGSHPEPAAQVASVIEHLRDHEHVTIGALAAQLAQSARANPSVDVEHEDDLAIAGRLLIRLLNHGALEIA